jgi:hypothetical protein
VPVNRSKSGHSCPNKNSPGCYFLFIYFGFEDFQVKTVSETETLLVYRYTGIVGSE